MEYKHQILGAHSPVLIKNTLLSGSFFIFEVIFKKVKQSAALLYFNKIFRRSIEWGEYQLSFSL
jgi:hypothetical protein